MKLWGGRFTKQTNELVEEFTASIPFDYQLWEEDIVGSLAHIQMLGKCGIIDNNEVKQIIDGLHQVYEGIQEEKYTFTIENEDIHMNIEKMLREEIGPLAGKLHTGRSRNDQVALDLHLYLRRKTLEVAEQTLLLQTALLNQAKNHLDTVMPGYTHMQRAQPVLLSHHLLAYVNMLQRDFERIQDNWKRINILPLGAGALAGTTFPIDREYVAGILHFDDVYRNSMDAVSDRDFLAEFLFQASLQAMHLSRLCEELVIWSSQEFSFIELDDAYCTGSSIMPQKKNPDVAELIRGKTGRVYGHLMGMLTILKGLPLTYNKDMQDDKEGMFDTLTTLKGALTILAPMIESMHVNQAEMKKAVTHDFANATDLADYLVRINIPFREAHEIVGKAVLYCITKNKFLSDLSIEEFKQFSPLIESNVYHALEVETVVNARNVLGGTARNQVELQLDILQKWIETNKDWVHKHKKQTQLSNWLPRHS
ncbi:argininosuccinate lyase [Shimazuella sp. AN120528]|uniref:argininosuccinate lyase n=1 Tax=Shimazuella soli TaxID=1892854 RepID=UPI001F10004B|nr:argininosuccinate lyase [Shimazuella soli]MCH5583748.1 argininosuccinate lyase [Shimazuella soli]